jgi:hypothetical protein
MKEGISCRSFGFFEDTIKNIINMLCYYDKNKNRRDESDEIK